MILRIARLTAKEYAATIGTAATCATKRCVPPYRRPIAPFTKGAANTPVATTPIVPPTPWHAHTSRESSHLRRARNFVAA